MKLNPPPIQPGSPPSYFRTIFGQTFREKRPHTNTWDHAQVLKDPEGRVRDTILPGQTKLIDVIEGWYLEFLDTAEDLHAAATPPPTIPPSAPGGWLLWDSGRGEWYLSPTGRPRAASRPYAAIRTPIGKR